MTTPTPLAPELEPLLGTWSGPGAGQYPTITPFEYREEVTFAGIPGKPFLVYTQRTRGLDGAPLHAEAGYWRRPSPGRIEVVIAQPSGLAEVLEGTVESGRYRLRSTSVSGTTTAKPVSAVERVFVLDGPVLRYTVSMAAMGLPMTHHLRAELTRVKG